MQKEIEDIVEALDKLALKVLASGSDDSTLREMYGWNCPAITRTDLAEMPQQLSYLIKEANFEGMDASLLDYIKDVPRRLKLLHTETIPHLFDGNGAGAIPAYIETLNSIRIKLHAHLGWTSVKDNKSMPASIARRLRSYQAQLDEVAPNIDQLQDQIQQIQDATEAAESLPTDLAALKDAKEKIDKFGAHAAELYGKIDERNNEIISILEKITKHEIEAARLVEQCGQAYRVTTTKGLAAAFDQRAARLGWSMWVWVLGLLASLFTAGYIGADRLQSLSVALSVPSPQWGAVWMHLVLSVISLGAPFWFAWIATKQIGQRFRLAEDYGFKASVAKAYEGYRREAARIDEAFEARLFSSALNRLEEAPLRLVEESSHGSPWHELVGSQIFRDAMNQFPELKDKFINLAKVGVTPSTLRKLKQDLEPEDKKA